MNKILISLFVLIISQVVFTRTEAYKVGEYDVNGAGCDNHARYTYFTMDIAKNPENKGLVVIYTGGNKERFGNILAYLKNAKSTLESWFDVPEENVSIIVLEGKTFFAQEFWIIPKGATLPYPRSYEFDWSSLESKYHFSQTCFNCEPSYPLWTDYQVNFEDFAKILKQYPSYKGQIMVNDYSELEAVEINLTKHRKLPRNRYSIQIRKKKSPEVWNWKVDLYLIPNLKGQFDNSQIARTSFR